MNKKPEDFTQAEVDAFQVAHADKSIKLTDHQARCLMADYEGDQVDIIALRTALGVPSYTQDPLAEAYLADARKRLHNDMIASRQAAADLVHAKAPLGDDARQAFQDDVDKRSKGGFKRGELIMVASRRLGSTTARKALAHFTASTRPDHPMDPLLMPQGGFKRGEIPIVSASNKVSSLSKILRNLAESRSHKNYRDKLQVANRILHPKKDKEGRLLPVRAMGESEARMIARPSRDAAMARALRVVSRHEEIQRLRREQNKKQFKKVKRHRKAWQ